VGQSPT
jgi:hypothetical protein